MKRWLISISITIAGIFIFAFALDFENFCRTSNFEGNEKRRTAITVVRSKKKDQTTKTTASDYKKNTAQSSAKDNFKIEDKDYTQEEKTTGETSDVETDSSSIQNFENGEKIKTYKSYVLSRIASKKIYPIQCRAKSQTGRVKLRIIIDPDGNLILAQIETPCDFEELNKAALNACKKAAPFKKIPNANLPVELIFAMEFKLD